MGRFLKNLAVLATGLAVAATVFSAVVAWRAAGGPVSLSLLAPLVEESLSRQMAPWRVEIGALFFVWDRREGAVGLRIHNARLGEAGRGGVVLPAVDVGLSPAALLRGRIEAESLHLRGPEITARRGAAGRILYNVRAEGAAPGGASMLAALARTWMDGAPDEASTPLLHALRRIGARDATIVVGHGDTAWRATNASVHIWRDSSGIELRFDGTVTDGARAAPLEVVAFRGTGASTAQIAARSGGIAPAMLRPLMPGLAVLDTLPAQAVRLEAEARLDDLLPLRWRVEAEGDTGSIALAGQTAASPGGEPALTATVQVTNGDFARFLPALTGLFPDGADAVSVSGRFDGAARLSGMWTRADGGAAAAQNTPQSLWQHAPILTEASLDLRAAAGDLRLPGPAPATVAHEGLTLTGRIQRRDAGEISATVERLSIALAEGGEASLSGTVTVSGADMAIALDAALTGARMADLPPHWPEGLVPPARTWVTGNIPSGDVTQASLSLSGVLRGDAGLRAFQATSVTASASVRNGVAHYLRPLPPARGVDADVTYADGTVNIALSGAALPHSGGPDGAPLRLADGAITLSGLGGPDAAMNATLRGDAALEDVLAFLEQPPLAIDLSGDGGRAITGGALRGDAQGTVTLALPLRADAWADQAQVRAEATLRDVTMENAFRGHRATAPSLTLTVDNDGLDITGGAEVAGMTGRLHWRETFDPAEPIPAKVVVEGLEAGDILSALGVDASPWLRGPARTHVEAHLDRAGGARVHLVADAHKATVTLAPLDAVKPPGMDGIITADVAIKPGEPVRISPLEVISAPLNARIGMLISPETGALLHINSPRILTDGTDISATITRAADGSLEASARGARLDARALAANLLADLPFSDAAADSGPDESPTEANAKASWADGGLGGGPLRLDVSVDSLTVSDAVTLRRAQLNLEREGGDIKKLDMAAILPRGGAAHLRYGQGPLEDPHTFSLAVEDAGAFLRATGLHSGIEGGVMTLRGHALPNGRGLAGDLVMRNYRLVRAPALAKVLELLSVSGAPNALISGGMPFLRLEAGLTLRDGTVLMENGRAFNASVGFSFEGVYEPASGMVNVRGAAAPAYALNHTLNTTVESIPLIGEVLTGGDGADAVVGANYSITGTADNPKVRVNPLSALTPGLLRRIFDILPEAASPAP